MTKNILCYGDSNTWGFVADSIDFDTFYMERFARAVRWTGLLQQHLGDQYYVIEEGLNGRTTNVDYKDFPGRNGKMYLLPCLYSHAPLDLVVLFLGANDLKKEFNRSAEEIATGVEDLIQTIQSTNYGNDMRSVPNILLIEYPVLTNESYRDINDDLIFKGGIERTKAMAALYKKLAEQYGCEYLETVDVIQLTDIDGIHFDETAHRVFAELLAKKIQGCFGEA